MLMATPATSLRCREQDSATKPMQPIKLIKNAQRNVRTTRSRIKPAVRNKAPQGVRSWVVEFKRSRRPESLMSFDSLFKDALSQRAPAD